MNQNEIRTALNQYIRCEILRRPDCALDDETPLISGGIIDSFAITHISVFMEKEFSVRIRDADLTVENLDSISLMARLVEKAMAAREAPPWT